MAEITKKKLASIYSLVVGFFLSAFSGHAQSGEYINFSRQSPIKNAKTTTTSTTTTTSSVITPTEVMTAPAPAARTTQITSPTGVMTAPAPTSSVGVMTAPAPDSSQLLNSGFINVESIQDISMKTFISQKAIEQGKNLEELSTDDYNTLRTDWLQMQVKSLEEKIQQLNEQTLSH